jgi:serine/threonine protein kinase
MALTTGDRLGPYEVLGRLGAGGMGEVYRARDSQLGRDVALKVLPDAFVADHDRVARFQREAKMLAALNHPHIGGIHGLQSSDGITALVLELVDGPTLADRIAQGAIAVDEALRMARQVATALEAAHEQGVVHRDLKPANIKVRSDDTVKVLDFGLAKLDRADPHTGGSDALSQSPTITTPAATSLGAIMGTAPYMSPEQARGKPIDKRTDIWAFGCVLYEMLTGRRAFAGDEVAETIAAILAREPDWSALPPATPRSIHRLLRRCLTKDRGNRLRDIGDARIEIGEALANIDQQETVNGAPLVDRRARLRRAVALAVVIVAVAAAAVAATVFMLTPSPSPEVRLDINTPPTSVPDSLAISPDGRSIVFAASAPDNRLRLWLRLLDSGAARQLPGTEGGHNPFWSPDSRSIGFFADNKLKRVDLAGGAVRTLTHVYRGTDGAWSPDGVILFSSLGDPIARVPAEGGEAVEVTGLVQEGSNFTPTFLPDGRRFLYYLRGSAEARGVYVGDLDGRLTPRRLFDSDAGAVYAPSGHLLFVRQRTLFAQPFDARQLTVTGEPFPVTDRAGPCACLGLTVSDTGSIAYRSVAQSGRRYFAWLDRAGTELGRLTDGIVMSTPSLSRDGRQVVGYRGNPADGNIDIWIFDTERRVTSRITSDPGDDVAPAWTPDGTHVVFSSNRLRTHDIYRKPASAGAAEELLLSSPEEKTVSDVSPDGRYVLFDRRDLNKSADLWAMPLDGSGQPFVVAGTEFEDMRGQFSPDAKWIAYQSDESGRHEIYVQRFPGPGHKWPISTNGGNQVRWRRDGKEVFYIGLDGRLMAVPIALTANGQAPAVGAPIELFTPSLGGFVQQADFRHQYMPALDGQRFLMAITADPVSSPITVILNWNPRPGE